MPIRTHDSITLNDPGREAAAPGPGDLVACNGKTIVTGGTGKFAKATGGNDLASHIRAISATGTAMGYTELTNYIVTY